MNETLEARWQDKSDRDRSKDAGAWICPICGQRLVTVRLGYIEKSRMCGADIHAVALLMPPHVDQNRPQDGEYFKPGQHFKKQYPRHARRLTHGQNETITFQAHYDEATMRAEVDAEDEEHCAWPVRRPHPSDKVVHQGAATWAIEQLREIRKQRAPESPTVVTPDKLPITVECPRPGCGRVSAIRTAVAGETAKRIAAREARAERHCWW